MRSATFSASSAPSGAAPDMIVCTDERSWPSTAGCLASATAIGGTTYVRVTAVLVEQAQELVEVEARHGDDRRPVAQPLVHDHRHPVDVEERQARRSACPRRRSRSAACIWHRFATRLWCESITPFGSPVVPLEYGSTARSFIGSISTLGRRIGVAEQVGERLGALVLAEHVDLVADPGLLGGLERRVEERRRR